MERLVKILAKRDCIRINHKDSIQKTSSVMSEKNIGCLPVVDTNDQLVGIISERDIARKTSKSDFSPNIEIENIMTKNVVTCDSNASAFDLLEIMSDKKIRHIPIVDNNKLLGIISIGDVVNRIIDRYKEENKNLKDYINTY